MNQSILTISLDPNIAIKRYGDSQKRHLDYAKSFKHFVVVILNFSTKKLKLSYQINNLQIYTIHSRVKLLVLIKAIMVILKINQWYHFDLVSSQDPLSTGVVAYLTKIILRIPFNLQLHSTFSLVNSWQKLNYLYKKIIYFLIKSADSIRVVNYELFKLAKNCYPGKNVKHIPLFIDFKFYYHQPKLNIAIKNFLFVGRLEPEKNLPLLIQAFTKVIKKYPKVKLTIVGTGMLKRHLKNLVDIFDLKSNVVFTGQLDRKQLKKKYLNSDVLVLSSNYEGWPRVVMEAFSAGLAVITTATGNLNTLIIPDRNAKVVKIGDSDELAHAMIWAIRHPKQVYAYALSGQELINKRFDQNKLKKVWIKLLKQTSYAAK